MQENTKPWVKPETLPCYSNRWRWRTCTHAPTHTDTHTYTHTYTHAHISTNIHAHAHMHTHTNMHTHTKICTHTGIHHTYCIADVQPDIHVYACSHACTHTHAYTHTYTHTYACRKTCTNTHSKYVQIDRQTHKLHANLQYVGPMSFWIT